jgi:uncharacterized membrane protein (DUF2068 family)
MRRPAGVTILAVLNYLVGAYLFVGSMFGLLALWLGPFAVVFWGVNALFFGLGYGLWKLRDWARWTQIVLSMIIAVGCLLLTIHMLRDDLDFDSVILFFFCFTVLNVVIILYLLRPQVKQAFGTSSHSGGGPEVQKASEP